MTEPLQPIAPPPPAGLPADKADAWDSIIDTVLDDETGELSLVLADPPETTEAPESDTDPAVAGESPDAAPSPPFEQGDPALRAWATQLAQENAKIRASLAKVEQRNDALDAASGSEDFIERFAQALPEDMESTIRDPRKFARIVTKAAERIAANATKQLTEQVDALKQDLVGMSRAMEFTTAASDPVQEIIPHVRSVVEAYAQNFGKSVFEDYSVQDVLKVAKGLRDQSKQQPAATTAPGQASAPPPAASPAPREARPPVTPAQRAAASSGVSVSGDDVRSIGKTLETGPRSFNLNIGSIIDDVIGDAIHAGQ